MLASFLAVSQQTAILFLLSLLGFVCSKKGLFSETTIKELSKFILYTVTPCVILDSFHRPFDVTLLKNLGIATGAAFGVHFLNILLTKVLIHDRDRTKKCVYEFAVIFGNCGYMGLPLQQVLLGNDGIFYCATFIAVSTIITWTYGLYLMTTQDRSKFKFNIFKILFNPGILGVVIGFVFFLTQIKLPNIILSPVKFMAALNTPLPMVIIGYYLSQIATFDLFKSRNMFLTLLGRLILSPLLILWVMYMLGLRDVLLVSVIISTAAPVAVNTVMFSSIYGKDSRLGVTLVSASTLLSIITLPIIVSIAMYLA